MRLAPMVVAILPAIALTALPASAAVTVTYSNPDAFTDVGDRNNDPVKVMAALERHLKELGERYLPPGEDLRIEILDVDRAGRPKMNLPTELRVVNGKGDMPCIVLSYTLVSGGATGTPKRERLCDPEFLRPLPVGYSENDPLVYEKRMLDEWFKARFAKGRAPG
jgi:hypothetical protein